MTIEEVYETWVNGNISDAKRHIKRMKKSEFLEFVYYVQVRFPDGWANAINAIHKLVD